ncbi:MAG TPA: hypothetical protein VGK97_11675 [Spongiibacteraceae bacterium]|jgi:hypothetical protein
MNSSDVQEQNASQGVERSINMAEIALRGSSTLIDIQLATLRNVAQVQARSAALFGLPDCSELFNATDKLVKTQLSAATDQLLSSTRQISQALSETQRQLGRVFQRGTTQLAEEVRKGVEEVGQRTRQSMQEFTDIAERQAKEVEGGMEGAKGGNGDMRGRESEETKKAAAQPRKS